MQTVRRVSASLSGPSCVALAASLIWIPLAVGVSAYAQSSAQQPEQGTEVTAAPVIPQQVRYTGSLATRSGDTVEAVFNIYAAQEGGEPLWTETQQVTVGADGAFTVLLGSVSPAGLPQAIFQGGAARWLGISVERAPEQARVLLSSVPYAMKSADAQALSGHPAGDFVTQEQLSQFAETEAQRAVAPEFQPLTSGTITGSGITGKIPQFTGTNTIGDSEITQAGSDIGILEPTPAATLDVNGTGQFRGTLTLPAMAIATASVGQQSQKLEWNASVWSSKLGAAVSPIYKLYAAGVNNNSADAAATLLFTYQVGTGSPSTILSLNDNGSFVTYGGVTAKTSTLATSSAAVSSPFLGLGASVFNSGSSSALQQNFDWQVIPTGNNTTTPSSNIALLYGSGTTAPAPTGLSISQNGIIIFATGQTFPGAVSTTGSVNAGSYDLNGSLFAYGGGNGNAFLGYAGSGGEGTGGSNAAVGNGALSSLTSGWSNSALGFAALHNNSSGGSNTAMGALALEFNSTGNNNDAFGPAALNGNTGGSWNNAFGGGALRYNINGNQNTAIGDNSGPDSGSTGLVNSTAIGANATVSQDDSLVLGETVAGSPGLNHVNVGIGTATPATAMEIAVYAPNALGPILTLTNSGGTNSPYGNPSAEASVDFKTYLHASTANSPTSRIVAIDDNYGNDLSFLVKQSGSDNNPLLDMMDIDDQGVDVENYLQVVGPLGIYETPPTVADFEGTVSVNGYLYADNIYASVKDFLIDHPSDPANKYLYHASVESSEMMNMYSGNVVTDELGLATVKLPDWFQAENTDFRYQLTTIGRDAHAWVAEEVANNQFKIATNATFVKVSWQITAVRQDAYAKAHPLVPEQEKPAAERGYYLHPELYGQPEERQIEWARRPKAMQQMKLQQEARQAALAQNKSNGGGLRHDQPASAVNRKLASSAPVAK